MECGTDNLFGGQTQTACIVDKQPSGGTYNLQGETADTLIRETDNLYARQTIYREEQTTCITEPMY